MPDSLLFYHISHPGFPGASSGYSSCFLQTIFRCEAFCMLVVVSPSHEQGITEQPITRTTTQLCSIFWNCSASVQSCSALLGTVQHCSALFGTALSLRRSARRHPIAIQWAGYRRPPFKGKCPINYCLPQIASPVLQLLWQNIYPRSICGQAR